MHQIDTQKLGGAARDMINDYLALPFAARPSCPYFNNKRHKIRGSLRVLKGKGTPEEIAEECAINGKLSRVDIESLSKDDLKKFLVDHDLGVDCSGFAYHVLDALCRERTGKKLASFVKTLRTGFLGSAIAKLRPAENIGTATFADENNSLKIQIADIRPGDIIVLLGTGKDRTYNHILVVTAVVSTSLETNISYAHSYAWPSDGVYGGGVREGSISCQGDNLLTGAWTEKEKTGDDNYTFMSAKNAKEFSIRRLKCFV